MRMRGASAGSVAGLTEDLRKAASTLTRSATVADDLFMVARTFRAEGALRRFATDGSIDSEAKTGLVRQIFDGKIDDATLKVVASAVGRRWTASRDLADALEHLGVVAHVTSSGANAERLADELFGFAQAVKDHPELRDALADPARSVEDKRGLLRTLLDGKALPATIALAEQSLVGSYRTVSVALTEFQRVAAEVAGRGVATVRVARPLPDAEVQRLSDVLSRQYGRPVHINLLVDPSVMGGVRVEIGDDVIDGTVSSRLDDARRRLAG